LGKPGYRVFQKRGFRGLGKTLEDNPLQSGLFNRGENEQTVTALWSDLKNIGKTESKRSVETKRYRRHLRENSLQELTQPWSCYG
jgi:hypothetical protein